MKKLIASIFALSLIGAAANAGGDIGVRTGDGGTSIQLRVNDNGHDGQRDHQHYHHRRAPHCVAWRSHWRHHHRERYCARWSR